LPEKIDIFGKFALKNRFLLVKLPEKIKISRKIFLEHRTFLNRVHDPPDFKSD